CGVDALSARAAMAGPQRGGCQPEPAGSQDAVLPLFGHATAGAAWAADHGSAEAGIVQSVPALADRTGSLELIRMYRNHSRGSLWRSALRVALLAVPLVLLAAQADAAEPVPKRGGTLVFAVDAEPSNYDCHANVSFAFLHPVAPHYSTLLKFDTANYPQITGDLAESWTVSPDKLTYSFKLRSGVLFHDGAPLTSADVRASYQRIVHPAPGV